LAGAISEGTVKIWDVNTGRGAAARADLTIMPLGDSLTHGYTFPGGYRTRLYTDLQSAGYLRSGKTSENQQKQPSKYALHPVPLVDTVVDSQLSSTIKPMSPTDSGTLAARGIAYLVGGNVHAESG
jgi:hypothetical protein